MKIHCSSESFDSLPYNRFFKDFVIGNPATAPFLGSFATGDVREAFTRIRTFPVDPAVLNAFNGFNLSEKQRLNRDLLVNGKAHVLVTGQQVVAFGGPLYVLLKALTAVVFARKWSELLQAPVVPVFWLADEDHDLEEITAVAVPSAGNWKEFRIETTGGGDGKPAGDYFPASDTVQAFLTELGQLARTEEERAILLSAFTPTAEESFKNWFTRILNALLADFGVLFMGSHHPAAKKHAVELFEKAFSERKQIFDILNSQSNLLEVAYHKQASPAEFPLFHFSDAGQRVRFEQLQDGTIKAGTEILSEQQWVARIRQTPERFSPNVFLRPILQDVLLPTLAYAGGPGEVAYHAQFGALYAFFDRQKPIVLPRFTASIFDPADARTASENGISLQELGQRTEQIEKNWLLAHGGEDPSGDFQAAIEHSIIGLKPLSERILQIDPTLVPSLERAEAQFRNELEKVQQKVIRAMKQKEETRLNKIRRLKLNLMPREQLQERSLPLAWFVSRFGKAFVMELARVLEQEGRLDRHNVLTLTFES